jgi:hypothetical protein
MLIFFTFVGIFCGFIALAAGIMLLARFTYDRFINSHRHRIKVIATYRRDYPKMHLYSVDPTDGMFGPPFLHSDPDDGYKFRAYSIQHAAERYFKSYRRRNKEMSDHEDSAKHECKPMWAHLRVKDMNTGFTYYLGN